MPGKFLPALYFYRAINSYLQVSGRQSDSFYSLHFLKFNIVRANAQIFESDYLGLFFALATFQQTFLCRTKITFILTGFH